jgi:hypothetical protein
VAGEVAQGFLAAERVTDEGDIVQAEVVDDVGQIVGEGVDVVAGGGPVRPAVTPAVIEHAAVPGVRQRRDLIGPLVGSQAPGVSEDDRRAAAPLGHEQAHAIGCLTEWHVFLRDLRR